MKRMLSLLASMLAMAILARGQDPSGNGYFVKGADLSLLKSLEDKGVQYKDGGEAKDALAIFKAHGCNYVRLRLFVNPDGTRGQVNTLEYTLALAKRVKAMGFRFLLDFHYSDGWADPGKQFIPVAWKDLSHVQLTDRVYSYTKETLAAFQAEGCLPDMVQVGNEINDGMMWPAGGPLSDITKFGAFADLLKSGIRAVREYPSVKVMVHAANGSDKKKCQWFFDHCEQENVQFDVIGLSYYPFTDGTLHELKESLAILSKNYGKDIMVAETGFFESGGSAGKTGLPTTPDGQKAFFEAVMQTVAATPGGKGRGVFYWAPEWIAGAGWKKGKPGGNRALFDEEGNALPAMGVYGWEPGKGG